MKKVLTVLTMVVFCLAAFNVQATDKNSKKNNQNKKIKVSKAVTTAINKSEFKGLTVVFYEDIKGRNSKKD